MDTVVPQGRFRSRPGGDVIQLAEGGEVPHLCMVGPPCGGGNAQGLESCELLGQVYIAITRVGVGLVSACGTRCLNLWNCEWERESAMQFEVPSMCCISKVKLYLATVKNSVRTNCISAACLQVPVHQISTTAWLSQWTSSRFLGHCAPQALAATRMVKSSFHRMPRLAWCLSQVPLIQWPLQ